MRLGVARCRGAMLALSIAATACQPAPEEAARPVRLPAEYTSRRTEAIRLEREGDLRGALRQAARALSAAPLQREAYALVSRIYVGLANDPEAVEFFRIGTRKYPKRPESWHYMGFHQYRLARWEDALASFAKAAELDPADPQNHFRQGLIRQAMGDFDGALQALRRAHGSQPDEPIIAARLSRLLRITGSYDQAERVVSGALERSPDSPDLHYALGQLQLRDGRNDPAEASLRRALELSPGRWDARFDLARLLSQTGRDDEARHQRLRAQRWLDYTETRNSLTGLLAVRGDDPAVVLAMAELELTEGKLVQAARWLQRAARLGDASDRLAALRAEYAVARGELREAESLIDELDADLACAALAAASLALARDNIERGLSLLGDALDAAPAQAAFLRRAADLYERAGESTRSEAMLIRAESAPRPLTDEGAAGMASAD